MSELSFTTQLIHAGERRSHPVGLPAATPIYASATYIYETMEEADRVLAGESPDFIYSRYGNPTVAALQDALTTAENGRLAVAYASGMAALHAAFLACDLKPGATVLASQDLYGATFDLLYKIFGSLGVKTVTIDFNDFAALRKKTAELKPRVLIAETISNPLLKVCDIEACAEIAHAAGARLIIDNTFASPFLSQPLELGADFSVHSATKYLGGHADATGGIVVAKENYDRPALTAALKLAGGVLSVWEAHHILRGIKTLALRLEKQCANAQIIAEHFAAHELIKTVYYPGLAGQGGDANIVKRVLRQPFGGALVTIKLQNDSREAAYRFLNALELCIKATSLGDVFTGVTHPASSSHRDLLPTKREKLGISEGTVRISVGIEDVQDIINDIERALRR